MLAIGPPDMSKILDYVQASNNTFHPCDHWDQKDLRDAYIRAVPRLHNAKKDREIKVLVYILFHQYSVCKKVW